MSPGQVLFPLLVAGLAIAPCLTTDAHGSARPPARYGHTAVYDMPRDRMLVFGGNDGYDALLGDLWALRLSGSTGWVSLQPAGALPPARAYHTAVYDALRDRIIIFGGLGDTGPLVDVWALSLSGTPSWTRLEPTGTGPTARYFHTAVLDAPSDRIVIFGGLDDSGPRQDLWALSLGDAPQWTALTAAGAPPSERYQHSAVYDTELERMVVFGGTNIFLLRADVWVLSFSHPVAPVWSRIQTSGPAPSGRSGQTAVFDPVGDRMVMFGGWDMSVGPLEESWALTLGGTPEWSLLPRVGAGPRPRTLASGTIDLPRNRLLIFGGTGSGDYFGMDDAWALPLPFSPSWRELAPVLDAPVAERPLLATLVAGPNPCRGVLQVRYSVPIEGPVELSILDLSGRLVQRLLAGQQPSGAGEVAWDANGTAGSHVEPGVYFVRLKGAGFTRTRRVVLVR